MDLSTLQLASTYGAKDIVVSNLLASIGTIPSIPKKELIDTAFLVLEHLEQDRSECPFSWTNQTRDELVAKGPYILFVNLSTYM